MFTCNSLSPRSTNYLPNVEGTVQMAKPGVQAGEHRRDRDHDLVHGDAEEEEGQGDPDQGIDHAEHPAGGGERGLLAVPDGRDHGSGEEEGLAKAPVGSVTGGQAHPSAAVLGHISNVGIKILLCKYIISL